MKAEEKLERRKRGREKAGRLIGKFTELFRKFRMHHFAIVRGREKKFAKSAKSKGEKERETREKEREKKEAKKKLFQPKKHAKQKSKKNIQRATILNQNNGDFRQRKTRKILWELNL